MTATVNCVLLTAAICATGHASSQVKSGQDVKSPKVDGFALVLPRIDQATFNAFVDVFEPSEAQNVYFEFVFEKYEDAVASLARTTAQAWEDAFQVAHFTEDGEQREPSTEDIKKLSDTVVAASASTFAKADQLWDELVSQISAVVAETQSADIESAIRLLNRRAKLAPERQPLSSSYTGQGIDVLEMINEATEDDGELQVFIGDAIPDGLTVGEWHEIKSDFLAAQNQYELEIQAWIDANYPGMRQDKLDYTRASGAQDDARKERLQGAAIQRAKSFYAVNRRFVDQIASMLERADLIDRRRRWIDRFENECHQRAFGIELPEAAFGWLQDEDLGTEETVELKRIAASYYARRDSLRSNLRQLMLRAKWSLPSHELLLIRHFFDGRGRPEQLEQLGGVAAEIATCHQERIELVNATMALIRKAIGEQIAADLDRFLTPRHSPLPNTIHMFRGQTG